MPIIDEGDRFELVTQTMLFLGVLAMGLALGAAIGLNVLQSSCISAGALPAPGSSLLGVDLDANPCWQGAKQLQTVANMSGIVGGVLLIFGGVLDRHGGGSREAAA